LITKEVGIVEVELEVVQEQIIEVNGPEELVEELDEQEQVVIEVVRDIKVQGEAKEEEVVGEIVRTEVAGRVEEDQGEAKGEEVVGEVVGEAVRKEVATKVEEG